MQNICPDRTSIQDPMQNQQVPQLGHDQTIVHHFLKTKTYLCLELPAHVWLGCSITIVPHAKWG